MDFWDLPLAAVREFLAHDLSAAEVRVLAAAQPPIRASALLDRVTTAAWRTKPSWYGVTDEDRMIAPALQREIATRHGEWKLGAAVEVGLFHQTDEVGWLAGRTGLEALATLDINEHEGMAALARYGLEDGARRPYETLSGGQKARLQVLGLELRGVNVLLLDEPTDNLDMASAEALEEALGDFRGTVLSVTHDRWFMRAFDRYLVFDHDCSVKEVTDLDSALHLITNDGSYVLRRSSVRDLTVSPRPDTELAGETRAHDAVLPASSWRVAQSPKRASSSPS